MTEYLYLTSKESQPNGGSSSTSDHHLFALNLPWLAHLPPSCMARQRMKTNSTMSLPSHSSRTSPTTNTASSDSSSEHYCKPKLKFALKLNTMLHLPCISLMLLCLALLLLCQCCAVHCLLLQPAREEVPQRETLPTPAASSVTTNLNNKTIVQGINVRQKTRRTCMHGCHVCDLALCPFSLSHCFVSCLSLFCFLRI